MSQLVRPYPCRFAASQPQHPFQAQGADALLLTCHVPHCSEPQLQGLLGGLENRTCCHRNLKIAKAATIRVSACVPTHAVTASRTAESVRPAHLKKILAAGTLTRESSLKFKNCLRAIFHDQTLHIVDGRVNRIALKGDLIFFLPHFLSP